MPGQPYHEVVQLNSQERSGLSFYMAIARVQNCASHILVFVCVEFLKVCLTVATQKGRIDSSPPKFVQVSRKMVPHMYQENVKRFITHVMRLSGNTRTGTQTGAEWLE